MFRAVSLSLVCLATVGSGLVHQRLTGSGWLGFAPATANYDLHQQVPEHCGPWYAAQQSQLPRPVLELLGCRAYVMRRYINRATGDYVEMILMYGPSGPLTVHTPDICYGARHYELIEEGKTFRAGEQSEFGRVLLRSRGLDNRTLDVAYAWYEGEAWSAPGMPRVHFAGERNLYKLQLATSVSPDDNARNPKVLQAFLGALLPKLAESLREPVVQR